jgi:hypothetical protein
MKKMDEIDQFPEPLQYDIRKALVHKEPNVNEALEMYICASRRLAQSEENLKDYLVSIGVATQSVKGPTLTPEMDHKMRLCDLVYLAQSIHFKAYRNLLVELYGEVVR